MSDGLERTNSIQGVSCSSDALLYWRSLRYIIRIKLFTNLFLTTTDEVITMSLLERLKSFYDVEVRYCYHGKGVGVGHLHIAWLYEQELSRL